MSLQRAALLFQGVLLVGAGCATSKGAAPPLSVEMEHSMIELRAQNAGYLRQVEELQNRIFVLEDQLESRRVAAAEPAAPPPLVSKRIGAPVREQMALSEVMPSDEDPNVEYAGEAALSFKRGRGRPVLKASGGGRASATVATAEPTEGSGPHTIPIIPLRLYRQSLEALRAGHNAAALEGFRKFMTRYPHHDYADNAQYWIGQCYYDLSQFKSAVREFRRVVERYPHGNKVPDAMLKIGLSDLAIGERRAGRQYLESLRRTYPKNAATQLAIARLSQNDEPAPPTVSLEMSVR